MHSFRAIAITAVVATHVIDYTDWESRPALEKNLALSVFQNGSVLFVFIAGLLFQYLSAGFDYRKYLLGKARFVVVPYLVASVPTLLHQYVRRFGIFSPQLYHGNWVRTTAGALLRASHLPRPFWFVPMIVLFYLLAPLFLMLDRKARWYLLAFPLSLVVAAFAHRPLPLHKPLQAFVYFLPSYIGGMAAGRFQAPLMASLARPSLRWGLTIGWIVLVFLEAVVLRRGGALWSAEMFPTPLAFDTNQLSKLLLTLALLGWLYVSPKTVHRRLFLLGELSFGVFFVHEYVLQVLNRLVAVPLVGSATLLLFGTAATTVASLALVLAIKRLSGKRSRFLVGC